MTQNDRVLAMLKAAGKRGVRSDQFFAAHMPRGAARIKDLRDQGYAIESEREGKYVRYTLISGDAGVGAGSCLPQGGGARDVAELPTASVDSGVEATEPFTPSGAPPELFDFSATSDAYRHLQDVEAA